MKYGLFLVSALFLLSFGRLSAQTPDSSLVQFSGMVLDGSNEQLFPVPYANILVKDQQRGTYSDLQGFFSIVVEKGDVIVFSAVGYQTVEFKIPQTLEDDRYSLVQLMTQDTINLPETVVFPWPNKDHFKLEFLAMTSRPNCRNAPPATSPMKACGKCATKCPKTVRRTAAITCVSRPANIIT